MILPREEHHCCRPVKSSRSGPFHRMVCSSLGVRQHLLGIRSSSNISVSTKANGELLIYVSPVLDPICMVSLHFVSSDRFCQEL